MGDFFNLKISSPAVKVYWGQWKSLEIINGKLYRCLDVIPPETQCKQWRSQPDNLVSPCKFQSITIIRFFRN